MKKLNSNSILLLLLIQGLERFTYFGFWYNIPMIYFKKYGFDKTDFQDELGFLQYIPILGLILSALLIDRVKIFRNFALLLTILIVGISITLVNTYATIIIGISILLLIGTFIEVNVLVKLFENNKINKLSNDRIFILLYIVINLFSGISSLIHGMINRNMETLKGIQILNLIIWIIFLIVFLFSKKPDSEKDSPLNHPKSFWNPLLIIILGLLCFLSLNYYNQVHLAQINEEIKLIEQKMNFEILGNALALLFGFILLFLKINPNRKIIFSIILILSTGIITAFLTFIYLPQNMIINYIQSSLQGIIFIILYPAIIYILLSNSKIYIKATYISIFLVGFKLIDLVTGKILLFEKQYVIMISFLLLLIALLIYKKIHDKKAAHNSA